MFQRLCIPVTAKLSNCGDPVGFSPQFGADSS